MHEWEPANVTITDPKHMFIFERRDVIAKGEIMRKTVLRCRRSRNRV